MKQDKLLSQILLSLWLNSSSHSPNSQAMLTCVVIHFIKLLIALNLVTVQCIYIMIYDTLRYIVCRVHFCSHKGCSFPCKSCWCTLFNSALLQQPKLLLCCCVECTKFHAVISQLLQVLTFMLLACISYNTLMFVQHLL